MKKHTLYISVFLLTFILSTTFICFNAWERIQSTVNPIPYHSIENGSPYSVIDKNKITIKPFDDSFEIPEKWLEYTREKNIFLDCNELNNVKTEYGGGFDYEDNQVINASIPFKDCAAHFGDKGWDNHLWNDLQGRVYMTDLTVSEISERIEKQGLNKAKNVFEKASVESKKYGDWYYKSLDVLDAPTHFILSKEICFYYRSNKNKTVVFSFIHADRYKDEIDLILDSFDSYSKEKPVFEKDRSK